MSEKLEKLKHEQYVAEKKLTAAKHKEKRLQSELKRLTRSERTHRLCTRAGMLETFLKEPTVLTDEDVMELLTFIFQSEAVQKKLNLLIESRRETQEVDEGENPCRIQGSNYTPRRGKLHIIRFAASGKTHSFCCPSSPPKVLQLCGDPMR